MNLKAAVIGIGEIGAHHARVISEVAGLDLIAVVDSGLGGQSWQGVPLLPTTDDLASIGIDLAVVATPVVSHEEVALQLCDMGIPALIEKPLAPDSASCLTIANAFEAAGVLAAVGHIERFNPSILAMKERLDEGRLGADIYQVVTRRQGPHPLQLKDVGVVLDLATHDLDLVSWVTGKSYETVIALGSEKTGHGYEDLAIIAGKLQDGTLTSHLVNWLSPLKERVVIATGENGSLVADTLSGDLYYHENGVAPVEWEAVAAFRGVVQGDVVRYALHKKEPLKAQIEAFRDAVMGQPGEMVTLTEAARAVEVAEAVLASVRNNGHPAYCRSRL